MWWVGSEAQLYLGRDRLSVRVPGAETPLALQGQDPGTLLAEGFAALRARRPKTRSVKLWLSAALARPYIVPQVPGLNDRREAMRLAQARAAELSGLSGPCQVWMGNWVAEAGGLAVAVERSLLQMAQRMAVQSGIRLASIAPAWNVALTHWLTGSPSPVQTLLALLEYDGLTLIGISNDRVEQARSLTPPPARVPAQLQRSAMEWDQPLSGVVCLRVDGLADPLREAVFKTSPVEFMP